MVRFRFQPFVRDNRPYFTTSLVLFLKRPGALALASTSLWLVWLAPGQCTVHCTREREQPSEAELGPVVMDLQWVPAPGFGHGSVLSLSYLAQKPNIALDPGTEPLSHCAQCTLGHDSQFSGPRCAPRRRAAPSSCTRTRALRGT